MAGDTENRPDVRAWLRRLVPGWVAWLPVLGASGAFAGSIWFVAEQRNLGYTEVVGDDQNALLLALLPLLLGWFTELPWASSAVAALTLTVVLELVARLAGDSAGGPADQGDTGTTRSRLARMRPYLAALIALGYAAVHLLPALVRVGFTDDLHAAARDLIDATQELPWAATVGMAFGSVPFLALAFLLWRIGRVPLAWVEASGGQGAASASASASASAGTASTEPADPAVAGAPAPVQPTGTPARHGDPLAHLRPSTSLADGIPGMNGDGARHAGAPAYLPPGEASGVDADSSLFEPPRG